MDPLVDERMLLAISATTSEIFNTGLGIDCIREAYGPTVNEGLCFEHCHEFIFTGEVAGSIFLGLDGYTRILLLPYLANKLNPDADNRDINQALYDALNRMFTEALNFEVVELVNVSFKSEAVMRDHKIVELPSEGFRKYVDIFFLKDENLKRYLGRLYIMIAIRKE